MHSDAYRSPCLLLRLMTLSLLAVAPVHAQSRVFTSRVVGGHCATWDFVGVDVPARRFYVPCGDHIALFELDHGSPVGIIKGLTRASAIAIASTLHRGFVNDGSAVTVFDTKTGRVVRRIPDAAGDAIAYEPVTRRVFPIRDSIHVIDARSLGPVGTVVLGNVSPESADADGLGHVVVALEQADQVAIIDGRTLTQTRWNVSGACRAPKSLSVDTAFHLALLGCAATSTIASLDLSTGRVTAVLRLGGKRLDQTGYDAKLHLLVNGSADHVITLVQVARDGALSIADTVTTLEPTRLNVGVDPITHTAFFAVVDPVNPRDGNAGTKPETFGVIALPLARSRSAP